MKKRNIIIATAAAMAMVAGVGTANALTVAQTLATVTTVQNVTVNATAATKKFIATGTVNLAIPGEAAAAGVVAPSTLQVNDVITITVAGAKFDRVQLAASPVTMTSGGAVATWVLDTTNTILTGTVTTKSTAAATGAAGTAVVMDLTAAYDVTGVAAGTNVTIASTVSRSVLGQNQVVHKIAANASNIIDVKVTPAIQKFTLGTKTTETATVASSFVKLDATSANATATTFTVPTGTLAVSVLDDSQAAATATGTIVFKLTGVPANATKINWATGGTMANLTQSNATGAAPATATTGSDFWLDGAGNAYAVLSNTGTKLVVPATAMTVTVDGTAAISPTTLSLSGNYLAGTADKYVSHSLLAATPIAQIIRNGSAFSVNSSGALNSIKITDMSGSLTATTGKISVTAYDAAGVLAVGTAPVIPALTSNGTNTIAMSTLTTAYPTAVRFDFVVESTEIVASNVKKSATGVTVTTYRNSSNSASVTAGNGAL